MIYEGCSKFFHLENAIFVKKKFLSPNFRELHVYLSRYMLVKILRKTWMCNIIILKYVPGLWSLVTLHSAAAALKDLRSALKMPGPCSPSSASSDTTSPQFRPPSFQGKAIFRQSFS